MAYKIFGLSLQVNRRNWAAGLATKLRVTYEEELKKYEHSIGTIAGSLNQEVFTTKPMEVGHLN